MEGKLSPLISFMEFHVFEKHTRDAIGFNVQGGYFSYFGAHLIWAPKLVKPG